MKRIISIVLCAIILALPLASCGRPSGDPDETSQRDAYLENRKKFLESDLYRDAVDYLTTVFSELLPDAETDFSLEPEGAVFTPGSVSKDKLLGVPGRGSHGDRQPSHR